MMMNAFAGHSLRVGLESGAPSPIPLAVHVAAGSLDRHGLDVVVEELAMGCVQGDWDAGWTDDKTITDSVRVFRNGESDAVRDRLIQAWTIAFYACLDLLALTKPPAAPN